MSEQTNEQSQTEKLIVQQAKKFSDKFTEQALNALNFADEEAAAFNHNYIGTEHLLLGILRDETSVPTRVLNELGIDLQRIRHVVEYIIGRGTLLPSDTERGLTPRAQVVVALAVSEGWRRSPQHDVDAEHLLLGVIQEGGGIAAGAILNLGVGLEEVRVRVLQATLTLGAVGEPLKEAVRNKSNVVTCRVDDQDMSAIDALVEVGIRSTRSDAASWLIHAGVEANKSVLDSVQETVMEIRRLRTNAQSVAQQLVKGEPSQ